MRFHPQTSWLLRLGLLFLLLASALSDVAAETRKSVIVIGGGYAGVEAATRLAKNPSLKVTLLDKAPSHTEITRLHQMAANNTPIRHDLATIAQNNGFTFRHAEVTGLKVDAKQIQTKNGVIHYDSVVVAVGGATSWPNVPGLKKFALGLRTPREATKIRNTVHQNLSKAANTQNPVTRRGLARIVIAGAGLTGVEMAAEMAQQIPKLAKQYGLAPGDISVHLVQRGPEILSKAGDFTSKDRSLVQQKLEKLGVIVHTSTQLDQMRKGSMFLTKAGNQQKLKTSTVIWAGGVVASPVVAQWGLPTGRQGRIVVDTSLRVKGSPGVYAVGDSAAAIHPKTKSLVAMTAQEAKVQAAVAAKNVVAEFHSSKLTTYKPKSVGTLVSLGTKDAVGRVFGIRVRGRLASLMKKGIEFRHKSGLRSARSKKKATVRLQKRSATFRAKRRTVRAR